MRYDTIYNDILKEIKPSPKDREEIIMLADKLMNIILEHAKSLNIEVKCKLVGSVSKKTSLVNKADIDIFIAFPLEYDEEILKEYGLHLGKYCIDEVNGKCEKKYASHPYITGHIDGYEVDFVPCYKIKDASELKSAVDRTILHTNYVQKHLTDEEADEVLLLKKFMTSVNTYGANYKVSGFSGYLCELLILHYHSFENIIKEAANKWHNEFKIDLENYGTCSNYHDPLIVIDPVDSNRNVAAALTMQKFSEFIAACRNYLNNRKIEYFMDKKIETSKEELIDEFNNRNTHCIIISFNVPERPDDVIYPQVNKTMNALKKISQLNDFKILKSGYYITNDYTSCIILEYEIAKLPELKLHQGPLVKDRKNSQHFLDKYPNAYISNEKWVVLSKRKYTTVEDMFNDLIQKENINKLKLGKNIKEEMLNQYSIKTITEYINDADTKEYPDLYMYLNPSYKLSR